jgi:antitoxin (DNA-binding transcriptional repressor) of toxin-antitoxin stability system
MKGFKVAEARARFGDLLDQAEHGEPVFIERKGVRFLLSVVPPTPSPAAGRTAFFTAVDPDVMSGEWTWTFGPKGLAFRPRRRGR